MQCEVRPQYLYPVKPVSGQIRNLLMGLLLDIRRICDLLNGVR